MSAISMALSLVLAGTSLLIGLLGIPLILGKVKPNAFYGLRTAKTLASPSVWYAANRQAGWAAFVGGCAAFVWCVFAALLDDRLLGDGRGAMLSVTMVVLATLGMVAYSFWSLHRIGAADAGGNAGDDRICSECKPPSARAVCIPFAIMGSVSAIIAVPLIRREVPPNGSHGFRTARTLSDPELWYDVNEASGWSLLFAGLLIATVALGLLGVAARSNQAAGVWRILMAVAFCSIGGVLVHSCYLASAY
jgi:uncharacterized membrane protein